MDVVVVRGPPALAKADKTNRNPRYADTLQKGRLNRKPIGGSYEIDNSENGREAVTNEALSDRLGGCRRNGGIPDVGPCPWSIYS